MPTAQIVVALIRRGSRILLVEALRREVAEETGLRIIGEPVLAFDVEVDHRTDIASERFRALTFACRARGRLQPDDPDGLVRRAEWVEIDDALARLAELDWYDCEPLRRFLGSEAPAGARYRFTVTGRRGSMVRNGFEEVLDAAKSSVRAIGLWRGLVILSEYDSRWPSVFERERLTLAALLGDLVASIEHVGSTAVKGLTAKPILDIALAFPDRPALEEARYILTDAGYDDRGDFGDAGGVVLAKGPEDVRTHYLHLVAADSSQWRAYLAFRDALRRDPGLRVRYAALKRELADRFAKDREAYIGGKASFIQATLNEVMGPDRSA